MSPRPTFWMKHLIRTFLTLGLMLSLFQGLATAAPADLHSYAVDFEGDKLWDNEFAKSVKDNLGGLATNVQIVVSVCRSSGFADEAKSRLAGNWSASTARRKTDKNELGVEFDVYNDNATNGGKTGLRISTAATEYHYAHGWGPQYLRGMQTDKNRTAEQLHNFATTNDFDSGNPVFMSGGTGKDAKLISTGKNRVAYWEISGENAYVRTARQILAGAGYTEASIDFAYNDGKNDVPGLKIDRKATRDELIGASGMIAKLKTELTGGAGDKQALIFLSAHGNSSADDVPKVAMAMPNQPFQGQEVHPGDPPFVLTFDDSFRDNFFEGPNEDRTLTLQVNPSFQLVTSEESYEGPLTILLDGHNVGTIELLGSSTGSYYDLVFSDSVWSELAASHDFDDDAVNVQFLFPPGASGSFRFATEWDFELHPELRYFGYALSAPALGSELATHGPPPSGSPGPKK